MVIEEMNVMTQHNSENRSTGSSIFSSNELTRNMPAKITSILFRCYVLGFNKLI